MQQNLPEEQPEASRSSVTDEGDARPGFWVAVKTKTRCEKKAAEGIDQAGFKTYVPLQTQMRQWSDRKKRVEVVIIPGTIFVRADETGLTDILRNPYVLAILKYPGQRQTARIPDKQINQLRFMLNASDTPVTFEPSGPSAAFRSGTPVRVRRGNLRGLTGQVERTSDGRASLRITLDLLGGARVEISPADLEPLPHNVEC